MSAISTWSTTAASNNSAAPDGWPEGMAPSDVNNAAREMMASIRTQHENKGWADLGHTVTYLSATTFKIATDVTAQYSANRRIRCTDSGTLYGRVVSSSYGAPDTTVTVVLDSGSLSVALSAVALGAEADAAPMTDAMFELIYPVGSIYTNKSVATNPATLFGIGTWVAIEDAFLIGASSTYAAESTGGSKDAAVVTHTHTIAHTHTIQQFTDESGTPPTKTVGGSGGGTEGASSPTNASSAANSGSAGSSGTDANLPPYVAVYMWERTA